MGACSNRATVGRGGETAIVRLTGQSLQELGQARLSVESTTARHRYPMRRPRRSISPSGGRVAPIFARAADFEPAVNWLGETTDA